jgi:hypothetical protein
VTRPHRATALAPLVAAAAACFPGIGPPVTAVAGAAPGHIVFALDEAPTTALYGLRVAACGGGRTMWEIGQTDGTHAPPDTIVYGDVPPGFAERVPPRALTPGCYEVDTSGPAPARFDVRADGVVASRPAPGKHATRSKTSAAPVAQPSKR